MTVGGREGGKAIYGALPSADIQGIYWAGQEREAARAWLVRVV